MRTRSMLTLPAIALAASCAGGQSTDPGDGAPPFCQLVLWTSPDAPRHLYSCSYPTPSLCDCDGTQVDKKRPERDATPCRKVIEQQCGVPASARTYCEHDYGECWPSGTDADRWLCDCGDASMRWLAQGSDCVEAGRALCAPMQPPCESPIGRCTARDGSNFACECPTDWPAVHEVAARDCMAALSMACAPATNAGSDGPCFMARALTNQPPLGSCMASKGRNPSDGFGCQCLLPGSDARFGKVIAASCDAALRYFCPEAAPE